MLKSFIIIAFRHLLKHKLFSAINVFCLALGLLFSMVIGVYLLNERSVNQFIGDLKNQYIVKSKWKVKEMGLDITTFGSLAKTAKEQYPALVRNYYRYNPVSAVLSVGTNRFRQDVAIGDTTLVSMYGFPVLYGNKDRAFININSAVVTASAARRLFGSANAVSRTFNMLTTKNLLSQSFTISAVLSDIPRNSVTSLMGTDFNVFVPTIGNNYYGGGDPAEGWSGPYEVAGLELMPGVSPLQMREPFRQILKKYVDKNTQSNLEVELTPVSDYYLKSNDGAVQKMINALSLIAAFILLIAIINFVDISTATSSYRLKEIGLRKVFGSIRGQLILQFISEALLLTSLAALIAIALYEMLRATFAEILNSSLIHVWQFDAYKAILLLLLVLIVGFVSGIYPAFVLSTFSASNAVKGKVESLRGGLMLRKILLTVQISLAVIVFYQRAQCLQTDCIHV